jgi:TetR/AcrR family transcriptional regulator, cholesterol catabolism regulator
MATSAAQIQHRAPEQDSRFDRRFSEILDYAADVFAEKGYEGASMRDLSRLSGMSLAGLYYYFDSKEKLLYYIQKHTFTTILDRLRVRLAGRSDPEERIRIFVHNHVDYAIANQKAMKVLSHEDDVLRNSHGVELAAVKREYYKICVGLVNDLGKGKVLQRSSQNAGAKNGVSTRTAVMGLFGMMNWLYTWYKSRIDPDAEVIARQISDIFLQGVRGRTDSKWRPPQTPDFVAQQSNDLSPKQRLRKRK